jgi:hypothetical protein
MKTKLFLILAVTFCFCSTSDVFSQTYSGDLKTVTLAARQDADGKDNYVDAAFSFEKGVNGESGLKIARNDWDLLFFSIKNDGGKIVNNYFTVTMVVDDCSRIKDLGKFEWTDNFDVPELPAYEKPTREANVEASEGHIYLVHTKDRDSDLYSLFRVEELKSGESVTISWKVLSDKY